MAVQKGLSTVREDGPFDETEDAEEDRPASSEYKLLTGTEAIVWNERTVESPGGALIPSSLDSLESNVTVTTAEAIATAAAAVITAAEDKCHHDGAGVKSVKQQVRYQLAVSPFIKVPERAGCGHADAGSVAAKGAQPSAVPEVRLNGVPYSPTVAEKEPTHLVDKTVEMAAVPTRHPWCRQFIESTSVHHSLEENAELRDRLALFRAAGWRMESSNRETTADLLNRPAVEGVASHSAAAAAALPEDHCEVMPVLFSSYSAVSSVAPNYCIAPWVVNMGLYGNYDISLGGFLEIFCFSPDYTCPNR